MWQTPLADALCRNDRTIRKWAAGESPIPDKAVAELRRLCLVRAQDLIGHANNLSPGDVNA
jgi:hypothetical protein